MQVPYSAGYVASLCIYTCTIFTEHDLLQEHSVHQELRGTGAHSLTPLFNSQTGKGEQGFLSFHLHATYSVFNGISRGIPLTVPISVGIEIKLFIYRRGQQQLKPSSSSTAILNQPTDFGACNNLLSNIKRKTDTLKQELPLWNCFKKIFKQNFAASP